MKGFTLIELLTVIVILVLSIVMIASLISGISNSNVTWGPGGIVEMRCINGLQFTVSNGHVRQVYDQLGHGVSCKP